MIIHESILTEGEQTARTDFSVSIDGEDASVDLVSRSVAKGNSRQEYHSRILATTAVLAIPNVTQFWLDPAKSMPRRNCLPDILTLL